METVSAPRRRPRAFSPRSDDYCSSCLSTSDGRSVRADIVIRTSDDGLSGSMEVRFCMSCWLFLQEQVQRIMR